jgi:hypothetical protein
MSKRPLAFAALLLTAAVIGVLVSKPLRQGRKPLNSISNTPTASMAMKQAVMNRLSHLPLSFEENRGQTDPHVKFLSRGSDYGLFLRASDATLVHHATVRLSDYAQSGDATVALASLGLSTAKTNSVVRLKWIGAQTNAPAVGVGRQHGISNYLLGNDRSKWHRRVPRYDKVEFQRLYPGIDLLYHGTAQQLEFDYNLAPYADPKLIQVGIDGPSLVALDASGGLRIDVNGDHVFLEKPVAYQERDGNRTEVTAKYVLTESHKLAFELGPYDTSRPLIIDPVLQFASNFGGGFDSIAAALQIDTQGDMYITGTTCATDCPVTPGVIQPAGGSNVAQDCYDVIVSELDATGSSLVYSTYLGGGPGINFAMSLLLDASGNPIVGGTATSTNFPTSRVPFRLRPKAELAITVPI